MTFRAHKRNRGRLFATFVLALCLALFAGETLSFAAPQGSAPLTGYIYSRPIVIDHTKVPNTDQSNFPVLIAGSFSFLATTANGGSVTNSNGFDISFASDAAGVNLLPFELESYNPANGAVKYWVKIPTLSHTSDTVIYIFYGNPAVTTDQSDKTAVWDANYVGVWHLEDNAASTAVKDSTSNGNNGTAAANTSSKTVSGQLDKALNFNGASDGVTTAVPPTTAFTWEAWINATSMSNYGSVLTLDGNSYMLMDVYNGAASFWSPDGLGGLNLGITGLNNSTWYHMVLSRSGNNGSYKGYLNGSFTGQTASGTWIGTHTVSLGKRPDGGQFFNGALDEVRVSNTARSADWISTEFNNQSSPSTFLSFGTAFAASPVSITSANNTSFAVGSAGLFTLTATGFPAPTLFESGVLPSGVTFNPATGVLGGTPAAGTGGVYAIAFTAHNGIGADASQSFTLTVNQPAVITSVNSASFTVGSVGSFTVAATGFPAPTRSEAGALPSGVTFNSATGVLGGTPASGTSGSYPITFTAHNGVGLDASQSFTLTVTQPAAFSSANNASFVVGSVGSFTVTSTGSPAPTLSESGALPSGVTFNSATGVLGGTPANGTSGSYPITFTAHNGIGADASQSFTLTVDQPAALSSTSSTSFILGSAGSFTVTATGFPAPTLSESGALPSGVTFNSATGVLGGTPASGTSGSYPITFTAHNGIGSDASQSFTLTVQAQVSNGYFFSRPVTIDHTKVPNTDQSNFPFLFAGSFSFLANSSNGGSVTNSNGFDISFASDSAGSIPLPFELESYDPTSGAVKFWVKIPTLSHTADTVIYVFYGNPAVTTDQSNKAAVWDANYVSVWHLEDNAASTAVKDSTSNGNNGTAVANTSAKTVSGEIDKALNFNGANDGVTTAVGPTTAFTWEAWINATSTSNFSSVLTLDGNSYMLMDVYNGAASLWSPDGLGGLNLGITGLNNSTWYHMVLSRSGNNGTYKGYLNGSFTGQTPSGVWSGTHTVSMGKRPDGGQFFNGALDEVRVSNTARSADWISTEFNNQSSPSTFFNVGASSGSPPSSITSANKATFVQGAANSFTVTATGFPAPTLSESGVLPSGVTFNSASGILSGTPALGTGGVYSVTFTAHNGIAADVSQSFTLTVNQTAAVTSSNGASFTVGAVGSFAVTATGFPVPTLSESGGLPSGVTFNAGTGVLSGTPASGTFGSYTITFTAHNGIGADASQSFALKVNQAAAFSSSNSASFTVSTAGSFTVTATGSPVPTLSESGALPSGVTFNSGTGVLSGTPASGTSGSYPITFTAHNGIGVDASQSFTLTVNQAATVTSSNSASFTVSSAGSFTVTATGSPAPTLSESGALPSGVTFNAGTGVLSGTPASGTSGSYPITFTAHNGIGADASQSFTLTVNQAAAFSSSNSASFTVSTAGSFAVTATGSPAPTLSESGALPSGITFNAGTGVLSGTPASGTSGSYPIIFTAHNGIGADASQSFTLTVNQSAAFSSSSTVSFTVGALGSFTVTATGLPAPTLSESGALPSGVTFNASTGVLSGTPASGTSGVYPITFTAHNGIGADASQSFTLTVNQSAAFSSSNSASFTVSTAGSFTVTATGSPAPTLSESGALPSGVTFNAGTGVLSGTPASGTSGSYPITFTAHNGVGSDASQSFTLAVNLPAAITSASGTTFATAVAGSFTVTATGFPTPTLSQTGALPSGVAFNTATGVLSGTPASGTTGAFPLTFTAHNGVGSDATQSFTLTVVPPPLAGYSYSRAITIDHTKVPNTDQANFPVLIAGTFANLATIANGGSVANSNGYDIVFASDSGGSSLLPFEQESYNPANGAVKYWVKVPTVSHSSDTVIYVFYGNPAVTTDQSNKTAVWDANYVGVWHLEDNAASTAVKDSTSNGNNGTAAANTSVKTVSGEIDKALNFNGASDGVTTAVPPTTAFTWEAWINATNTSNFSSVLTLDGNSYMLMDVYNGTASLWSPDGLGGLNLGITGLNNSTWYHMVLSRSGNNGTYKGYLNGTLTGQTPSGVWSGTHTVSLGKRPDGGQFFNGALDEVRVSNTARSADWISTEFNNQSSPSTFLTMGTTPTITSASSTTFGVGVAGAFAVTATGTGLTFLEFGALPSGVAFNTSTGLLSGTPANGASGVYAITFTARTSNGAYATQSFTLTVLSKPVITTQPVSQTVVAGQTATFMVAVTGLTPMTFQWKRNNVNISGANSSTYTTPVTTSSDNGAQFKVYISNASGNTTSNVATLTVNTPPTINSTLPNQTLAAGEMAIFTISASATGSSPLTYQWYVNNASIPGATTSVYTTPLTTVANNGDQYRVTVSNAAGSVPSNTAILTVVPHASPATYYVDFASGSDINAGISKDAPWQFAPGMNDCGYNCAVYGLRPGDRVILKGGVTWANGGFPMVVSASGTSGNPIYYGVDQTWYAGNSWSRPVFDLENGTWDSAPVLANAANYVTFDNLEIKNEAVVNSDSWPPRSAIAANGGSNITVENCYIHGWSIQNPVTGSDFSPAGGIAFYNGSSGGTVQNCVLDGSPESNSGVGIYGGAFIHGNTIENVPNGMVLTDPTATVTGNQVFSVPYSVDPSTTSNAIYAYSSGTISNNIVHDLVPGASAIVLEAGSSELGNTQYVYNNLIWNVGDSSPITIGSDLLGPNSPSNQFIYNNTFSSGAAAGCISVDPDVYQPTNVTVQNNHCISEQPSSQAWCWNHANGNFNCGSVSNLSFGNNVLMTSATAAAQGYMLANSFEASASTGATVGAGLNLISACVTIGSSLCSDRLGVARPGGSTPWDAGAYQYQAVLGNVAPSITAQPMRQEVTTGHTATFSVIATGTAPLSYQWLINGAAISGATSSTYSADGTTADGTLFSVVVSNAFGSVTSSPALLSVSTAPGQLTFSPAGSLSFGTVSIGTASAIGVTLTNNSSGYITISNVAVAGSGFNASGVPAGIILAPGQFSTLSVVFAPSGAGPVTGSVTISSDAVGSPTVIPLSGTGAVAPHSTNLHWNASTSAVFGYYVYRATNLYGPYTRLNSTPITVTQFTDLAVLPGQTYLYWVTGVDSNTLESAFSNSVTVVVPAP
jgi:hypothetical protein